MKETNPMSVNANAALELSKSTGQNIDLCRAALERGRQDIGAAKKVLERWLYKKPDNHSVTSAKGVICPYVNRKTHIASMAEAKTDNAALLDCSEFKTYVGGVAFFYSLPETDEFEKDRAKSSKIITTARSELEKKFETKLTINALSLPKSDQFSLLTTYQHRGVIGVIVETKVLNQEAYDHKDFRLFSFRCAMNIAVTNPLAISKDKIPTSIIEEQEREIEREVNASGKEVRVWKDIIDGKMRKWKEINSFLDQDYIFEEKMTVEDKLKKVASKINSDIEIVNFVRLEL